MWRESFYTELGKFLYAVAISDGIIQEKETQSLDEAIASAIMPATEKGSEEVILTKLSFYTCAKNQVPSKIAAESFEHFLKHHAHRLDANEKEFALKLIRKIGSAFHGKGSAERKLEETVSWYLAKSKSDQQV